MRSLALCALLLLATSASADDVRYPATGTPAVTFKVPDGWVAKAMDGKMVVESPDISTVVTILIEPWSDSLDALAADSLKDEAIAPLTADDRHNISVLDLHGVWWKLTPTDPTQKSRPQAFVDVMLADGTALTGLIVSPDDEGSGYHAGLHLLDRLALAKD